MQGSELYPLVYMQLPDFTMNHWTDQSYIWQDGPKKITELRNDEYSSSLSIGGNGANFIAFYSTQKISQMTSLLSIIRTLFICLVLSIASYFFTNDANTLVLNPIERMLEIVKLIAKNPLAAASDEVQKAGMLTLLENQEHDKNKNANTEDAQYETAILEKAIIKIGHLLALGFGEAGAKIIAQNIGQQGDLDPMMSGQRVFAIFGFCDIRNFTDSTEILQTDVMKFVN